jgi:hypothetical protein
MGRRRWIAAGVMAASVAACCSLLRAQECGCETHSRGNGTIASGSCLSCQHGAMWGHHAVVGKAKFHRLAAPPPSGVVVSSLPIAAAPATFAMTPSLAYPASTLAMAPPAAMSTPVVASSAPFGMAAAPVIYGASPFMVPAAPINAFVVGQSPVAASAFSSTAASAPQSYSAADIANLTTLLDALRANRSAASPTCANSSRNPSRSSALAAPQPPSDPGLEERVQKLEDKVESLKSMLDRIVRNQEQRLGQSD